MKKLLLLLFFISSLFSISNAQKSSCLADFTFVQDSSNINANLFYFTNQSFGNVLVYEWTFGDGSTSNFQNPAHIYAMPGIYQVCLVISDTSEFPCTDTFCSTVDATIGNPLTLGGQVFLDGLPINQSDCYALLYSCDTSYNLTYVDDFLIDTLGYYYFHQIAASTYKVFVESRLSPSVFIPTWYGDNYLWTAADTIMLNSNNFDNDIHLVTKNVFSGPASASGSIELHPFSPNTNADLSNVSLNLYDSQDRVVDSQKTDSLHKFVFQNLLDDTYYIIPNLPNYLYQTNSFTIANSYDVNNIKVFVYQTIYSSLPNTIKVKKDINVFPNPSSNIIYIESEEIIKNIQIFDINSKMVYYAEYNDDNISINIQNLIPATYVLKLSTQNNVYSKLIIKN